MTIIYFVVNLSTSVSTSDDRLFSVSPSANTLLKMTILYDLRTSMQSRDNQLCFCHPNFFFVHLKKKIESFIFNYNLQQSYEELCHSYSLVKYN